MATQEMGTYFNNVEHVAEMTRLIKQARMVTQSLGGPFPRTFDAPLVVRDVLDIACGPGEWVVEVARKQPAWQVTGIDLSEKMIAFGHAIAQGHILANAHFHVMDATKPLSFSDNSFDLINARFIFGFMPNGAWPKLLNECQRILRPGGALILNEGELPLTNSPANERMHSLFAQALYQAGQSFSPDGRQLGITPVLSRLVRNAGFEHVQLLSNAIDFSAGTELHESYYRPNYTAGFLLAQPFLMKMGVTTQLEITPLYEQMLQEITAPDFCAFGTYLNVWGYKPGL